MVRFRLPGRSAEPVLPNAERAALELHDGERVLAAAPVTGGGWAVASEHALHLPGARLPWFTVLRAAWDRDDDVLTVETVTDGDIPGTHRILPLDTPGRVPEVVRERVSASIVLTERVWLRPSVGLLVVARRVPGSTELGWQLVLDEGLDPQDPELQSLAQQALEEVRTRSGL
jgi:hypothetical protein